MDIYKLKFTQLQVEIMRFLFKKVEKTYNVRNLAKELKVSPTAISKSIKYLETNKLLEINRNTGMNLLEIALNTNNPFVIGFKRADNLKQIIETQLTEYLSEKVPGATIVLFGSYSRGEDTSSSDIDIAIIGSSPKELNLKKFEKILEREISLNFYKNLNNIDNNLKNNIINGIILKGGINI